MSFHRCISMKAGCVVSFLILVLAVVPFEVSIRAQVDGDVPVMLNFDNADLNEVINFVAETLGLSFIVDSQVAGRVTIKMDKAIKKRDLFAVFETILRMNNTTIVRVGPLYEILPISSGVKLPIGVYDYSEFVSKPAEKPGQTPTTPPPPAPTTGAQVPSAAPAPAPVAVPPAPAPGVQPAVPPAPPPPQQAAVPVPPIPSARDAELFGDGELAIHIVPVEFLPAEDMRSLIAPYLSNGGTMVIYQKANLLIITDFKDNVKRLRQIISALDGRIFENTFIDLIKIKYYAVKEVAEDLAKVIAGSAKDLNVGITIIPIERLNSILVVANSSRALEKVHSWIDRLDIPQGRTQQTFIYQVQNSTANNIATILSQLYAEGGPGAAPAAGAPAPTQPPGSRGRTQADRFQPTPLGPQLRGSLDVGAGGTGGPTGAIKIIVDELNNSLVIQASEPDYEYILQTIRLLDVLPRQVLIEAKIFEVDLTDDLSMGVQWFFERLGGVPAAGSGQTGTPAQRTRRTTDASIGINATGGQFSASTVFQVSNTKQVAASLFALRSKTKVRILEAPSILALDGKEAKIEVGQEVPISTSTLSTAQQVAANQSFFNQIQYRPTGVILAVNPRISASGMVTMEIAQEVSSVPTGETLTPRLSKSSVSTSVVVKDGEGVVIAGVIRENLSNSRNRVPILGDIPILGYLFGTSGRSLTRSEIVVLITPHVIKEPAQHTALTLDYEAQLKEVRNLIRSKQRELAKHRAEAEKQREKDRKKAEEKRQLEDQEQKQSQDKEKLEQREQ